MRLVKSIVSFDKAENKYCNALLVGMKNYITHMEKNLTELHAY